MAKNTVNAGFMTGATFYCDNPEKPPYLKKGFLGQKYPLSCETVSNVEVVDAQGRRDTASAVTRGVAGAVLLGGVGAIAGLMSSKGLVTVIIKLKNGASLTGEIDKGIFQGLQRHAIDWGTEGVEEPGSIFETCSPKAGTGVPKVKAQGNYENNMVMPDSKATIALEKYTKETESKMSEMRAKYGPGYDKTMTMTKAAFLAVIVGGILLAVTDKYTQVGAMLLLVGFLLSVVSLIRLCWGRYKASKGQS